MNMYINYNKVLKKKKENRQKPWKKTTELHWFYFSIFLQYNCYKSDILAYRLCSSLQTQQQHI